VAARCKAAHTRQDQAVFGIVQGGVYADLRRMSVDLLGELDLPGYGIGGYSVGEPHDVMLESLAPVALALPADKPRYLMGVGNPTSLLQAIALGIDMFDCVLPTRTARIGTAFSSAGRMNLKNAQYASDFGPLDPKCTCTTCTQYSRPTCATWCRPRRCSARSCSPCTTCTSCSTHRQGARGDRGGGVRGVPLAWMSSPAADDY